MSEKQLNKGGAVSARDAVGYAVMSAFIYLASRLVSANQGFLAVIVGSIGFALAGIISGKGEQP